MLYVPLILLAIFQLILAAILWFKRKDRVSKIFILLTVVLLLWTLINVSLSFLLSISNGYSTLLWINVLNGSGFFLAVIIIYLLFKAIVIVTGVDYGVGRIYRLIPYSVVSLALLSLLQSVSGRYIIAAEVVKYEYGPLSLLLLVYFIVLLVVGVRRVTNELRNDKNPLLRKQAVAMLLALFLSGAWALLFIIILPVLTKNDRTLYVGYLAPYIFTLIMYYGVLRLGLFNFKTVIARTIAYLLALVGFGAVYALVVYGLVYLVFRDTIPTYELVAILLIGFTGSLSFIPTKKFFDKITNILFYSNSYSSDLVIKEANKVMVNSVSIEKLMEGTRDLVNTNLKSEFVLFSVEKNFENSGVADTTILEQIIKLMDSKQISILETQSLLNHNNDLFKIFNDNNIELAYKIEAYGNTDQDKPIIAFIGHKKSGREFSSQDINVISVICNELSVAIQNALQFEEIQKFNETLQGKVENATRKLQRTNEKLKQLDETKDEFISMASHQLRTPLTSVKGYVSMVLEGDAGPINDNQRKLLEQSFASSQRMVYLISDLLNLSRLRTGKFVIEPKMTNLADVIESEVEQLRANAAGRGLTLTYDKPKNFPDLYLDETKIRQVIMNFSDNAIYYTPSGGKIKIALTDNKDTIEFTVTDNGIGVPADEQKHLFTKFYRAKNAQKSRPDGTGLGIFMAKKVIIAQGGALIFKSKVGKGSTFGFTLEKSKLSSARD